MKCTNCSKQNPKTAKFCASCGQEQGVFCPQCQAPVTSDSKFCFICGEAIRGKADNSPTSAHKHQSSVIKQTQGDASGRTEKRKITLWVCLGMGIMLACSVTFTPRARGGEIDEGVERFTIPGTDQEVSYQVSEEGEALFWLEDQPDLEPLTSRVISEERGSLEWNGAHLDGYGELDGEQSTALAELFNSPYGQAVPLIALQRACQANSDLTAKQLAALLYPWQMHLKYSPVDRVEEAQRMWDASGCADAFSQPPDEINEDTPILIYSNAAYVPVVFGYFPFDAEGAFELESTSVKLDSPFTDIILMAFQANEPINQETDEVPYDQFGPCKSKCRGACGADCTSNNCEVEEELVCEKDAEGKLTGFQVYADLYICGLHPGCIDHDACYDECNTKYGCNTWKAAYCRHSGIAILGQYGCDMKARQQYGTTQCIAWARGYPGPLGKFDTYKAFVYVRQPVGVRISNPEVCRELIDKEKIEPVQFTMTGEFMYLDFDYLIVFGENRFDCPPGKGSLSFTIWNTGASGGEVYGVVDSAGSIMPEWSQIKRESVGSSGTSTTETCNVYDYHKEMKGAVTFSGGSNGVVKYDGIEMGRFIDGKVFVFSGNPFSGNQITVPDPSVFEGL